MTAPGQGVQRPGMLDPWLDAVPGAPALVADWSRAAGFDLVEAGRDEALLADTAYAQPLIVAASLLAHQLLRDRLPSAADEVLFAGHSVGELAAAAGAGYLSPRDAVALARVRGAAMSAACAVAPTGMAAVMPARRNPASDEEIVAAVGTAGLTVANFNGSHQFVAAGPADRVEALADAPPPGIRVSPLAVAGAFHTEAMAPAVAQFARAIQDVRLAEPASALLGNGEGEPVAGPEDLRRRLITQITSPVRWDLCAQAIARRAPGALHIELAPAGPLTRLLQRARPEARAVALGVPEDLDRVLAEAAGSGLPAVAGMPEERELVGAR
ncbi:ACP S-malonyltransferase [Streptomyces camelliae]|uniref:[acyl-carrier-protein] S-malonyltransferase n=1 Tax=Streptomyces camelliae TaxID=3004093 RepID=A0ABY7P7A5_9ACTN|nr:ACP S-malonyltransferase [Streptomyces sp. HUAS 2-6]WBO66277.1 ACP S-malonyltransferase [Streptomyces sp. HUAS 2-6]